MKYILDWCIWKNPEGTEYTLCLKDANPYGPDNYSIKYEFFTQASTEEEHFELAKEKEKELLGWD